MARKKEKPPARKKGLTTAEAFAQHEKECDKRNSKFDIRMTKQEVKLAFIGAGVGTLLVMALEARIF